MTDGVFPDRFVPQVTGFFFFNFCEKKNMKFLSSNQDAEARARPLGLGRTSTTVAAFPPAQEREVQLPRLCSGRSEAMINLTALLPLE